MGETRSCFPLAPFTARGRSVPCYTLQSASEKLMSASAPSPRPFGPYVLTHALGTDALGEAWRAGTAGAPRLKPFLLVRTFTAAAIDRSALLSAMETAVNLVDDVQGPTIARGTVMGAIDDIPFLGTLYVEGRTLDHLLAARLLGSPLPVEHGLLIAERLLTALEAGAPVERFTGAAHGFLVPPFVCISNEGETRVFGHGLGAGLLPALKNARTRQTFAPYVAPEVLAEGKPSTPGDLYSVGAILYEALTGRAPPPGVALESVEGANLAVDGTPVPEDIRRLLRRALHPDPRMRDRQISSFRRDLSALLYGGPYAPSTFNLAFFLQKHFDKAIQLELLALDRLVEVLLEEKGEVERGGRVRAAIKERGKIPSERRDLAIPHARVRMQGAPKQAADVLGHGCAVHGEVRALDGLQGDTRWRRPARERRVENRTHRIQVSGCRRFSLGEDFWGDVGCERLSRARVFQGRKKARAEAVAEDARLALVRNADEWWHEKTVCRTREALDGRSSFEGGEQPLGDEEAVLDRQGRPEEARGERFT